MWEAGTKYSGPAEPYQFRAQKGQTIPVHTVPESFQKTVHSCGKLPIFFIKLYV